MSFPERTACTRLLVFVAVLTLAGVALSGSAEARRAPTCDGKRATIVGHRGPDVLRGTPGPDVIIGRGGDDIIRGRGGNDVICGGAGNDRIVGGRGRDRLHGLSGRDAIVGRRGSDRLFGYGAGARPNKDGRDELSGGGGHDWLDIDDAWFCCEEDRGADTLKGGRGRDLLGSSNGSNVLRGGADMDAVHFPDETEASLVMGTARHGRAKDRLFGIENLSGSQGDDVLIGDDQMNRLFDGFESSGNDILDGGGGGDVLVSSLGDDQVDGGAGADVFEVYCCIDDFDGADVYRGGEGDDLISAGLGGADTIDGGPGTDTVSWELVAESVEADLEQGTAAWRGEMSTLAALENLIGTQVDDQLRGDGGDNFIAGSGGDDVLDGRAGTDVLDGGEGTDTCSNGETLRNCE